jgi:hypothetical protein
MGEWLHERKLNPVFEYREISISMSIPSNLAIKLGPREIRQRGIHTRISAFPSCMEGMEVV